MCVAVICANFNEMCAKLGHCYKCVQSCGTVIIVCKAKALFCCAAVLLKCVQSWGTVLLCKAGAVINVCKARALFCCAKLGHCYKCVQS